MTTYTNSAHERNASIDLAQLDMPDPMRDAGWRMANVMYNMAQRVGYTLTEQDAENLRGLQQKWDAAALARRSLTSGAPAGHVIDSDPGCGQSLIDVALEPGAAVYRAAPVHDAAAPSAEQARWVLKQIADLNPETSNIGTAIFMAREGLASGGAAAKTERAPTWGKMDTVGDMVRNLLTLDQAAPIFAAFHVDIEGGRRCRTKPVAISRERVIDGKWVDSARKDVPYAHVVWAKPSERVESATAAGTGMRECPDCDGTQRISPDELCSRCGASGVLPVRAVGAGSRLQRDIEALLNDHGYARVKAALTEFFGAAGAGSAQPKAWKAWLAARAALPASVDAVDLPPLPEMMGVADLGSVMETPDGWDEDYRATWQQLQVADCNKRQWRAYALELRGLIAADRRQQVLTRPAPAAGTVEKDAARPDFLKWWTSIETDVRKSMLVWAGRDRERLFALMRTTFDAAIEAHNKAGKEQG